MVLVHRWKPKEGGLIYKNYVIAGNRNKRIAELHLVKNKIKNAKLIFIELAFVPCDTSEYY